MTAILRCRNFEFCCGIYYYFLVIREDELLGLVKLKTLCELQENLFGVSFVVGTCLFSVFSMRRLYGNPRNKFNHQ
jgi:hypothetical protein